MFFNYQELNKNVIIFPYDFFHDLCEGSCKTTVQLTHFSIWPSFAIKAQVGELGLTLVTK